MKLNQELMIFQFFNLLICTLYLINYSPVFLLNSLRLIRRFAHFILFVGFKYLAFLTSSLPAFRDTLLADQHFPSFGFFCFWLIKNPALTLLALPFFAFFQNDVNMAHFAAGWQKRCRGPGENIAS